jgi:mono/diheme cytochrome c family protein
VAVSLAVSGCVEVGLPADGDQTHAPIVPIFGMHDTISYKDQESQRFVPELPNPKPAAASGMRYSPPETITRDSFGAENVSADRLNAMGNPVPLDKQSLAHGEVAYNTTCISCHGKQGKGNGPVADAWGGPEVPSLVSEAARNYSDGQLYQIISHGKGTMWSYKSQLRPMERWAVVNWIRVLQRAHHPEPWDDTTEQQTAQVN